MLERQEGTKRRKSEHIDIVLKRDVTGKSITTGFERYRFRHQALPECDFADVSLETAFLGKRIKTPLLISSMTGGTKETGEINRQLAMAAQARGWVLALGSMRVALEYPEAMETFQMRHVAPDIPILANVGAVQLNKGLGVDECLRLVEQIEADGLILHLNPLQEVFQPEGDTEFSGLLDKIERLCRTLEMPVGIKEVGWGIHGELAKALVERGVAFIDVAGAGGTSWSQVEKYRSHEPVRFEAADAFVDWGIPTSQCILEVRHLVPEAMIIASGGVKNGVEAAKAIALGADLVGFGRTLLQSAVQNPAGLIRRLEQVELEMRMAMFATGIRTIKELKNTERMEKIKE
ncbi:type 2 isopentenyl-diphosphate Delta-isomerase [Laceyella putida]|uniref:Isopentenyl-diphosphate delta-isomerase n=1 Tax=Laceyella putida TaxID=110101 RepID=A0ABW2RIF5_9BACL